LDRFDEIIEKRGYSSRSEALRDAIRSYIVNYEWMNEIQGERVGVISLVYEHDQRGLANDLTEIQHRHMGLITSSVHVHLDQENCLEIIVLHGAGEAIRQLAEAVMALKGVKYVKLNAISPGTNYRQLP
jgi:CopG family nickel-responsive transcriptional regulator